MKSKNNILITVIGIFVIMIILICCCAGTVNAETRLWKDAAKDAIANGNEMPAYSYYEVQNSAYIISTEDTGYCIMRVISGGFKSAYENFMVDVYYIDEYVCGEEKYYETFFRCREYNIWEITKCEVIANDDGTVDIYLMKDLEDSRKDGSDYGAKYTMSPEKYIIYGWLCFDDGMLVMRGHRYNKTTETWEDCEVN